jgi:glycosyltransferase involved in cell wall biosynthesis
MICRIVIIGQFPPIITGQSLITQYIFEKLVLWGVRPKKIAFNQIEKNKWLNYLAFYLHFIATCSSKNLVIYLSSARSNLGYLRNFVIINYAFLWGNKIVLHYHCGEYDDFLSESNFFVKWTYKKTFDKVNFHIFLSSRLLPNFNKLRISKNKIIIIPNSITKDNFAESIGFKADIETLNIIYLSNMIPSKGYMILLEAIEILVSKYKKLNFKCEFYGEFISEDLRSREELHGDFFRFINDRNLSNYVKYGGLISGIQKENVLKKANIFILPTMYPVEAQPLSILEALSCKILVVASNYRSIPDMIIDNKTGVLLLENNSSYLASKLNQVFNNSKFYEDIAIEGRNHFEQNFSNFSFDENLKSFFNKFPIFIN